MKTHGLSDNYDLLCGIQEYVSGGVKTFPREVKSREGNLLLLLMRHILAS
jgi:hypothetical protein